MLPDGAWYVRNKASYLSTNEDYGLLSSNVRGPEVVSSYYPDVQLVP